MSERFAFKYSKKPTTKKPTGHQHILNTLLYESLQYSYNTVYKNKQTKNPKTTTSKYEGYIPLKIHTIRESLHKEL